MTHPNAPSGQPYSEPDWDRLPPPVGQPYSGHDPGGGGGKKRNWRPAP